MTCLIDFLNLNEELKNNYNAFIDSFEDNINNLDFVKGLRDELEGIEKAIQDEEDKKAGVTAFHNSLKDLIANLEAEKLSQDITDCIELNNALALLKNIELLFAIEIYKQLFEFEIDFSVISSFFQLDKIASFTIRKVIVEAILFPIDGFIDSVNELKV